MSAETKVHVQEIYQLTCPISQHQKDMRKRRLGPHVVQVCCHPAPRRAHALYTTCARLLCPDTAAPLSRAALTPPRHRRPTFPRAQAAQAMIQTVALDEIYRIFTKTYPLDKLAREQFRLLKPWNLIKAYRET